jgi:hypothetical protein
MQGRNSFSALAALAVGLTGAIAGTPATASACVESCSAIRASHPAATDGYYELVVTDMKFQVYCYDMAGTPREYIDVPTGEGINFSQYSAGGASPGSDVRTSYARVRLDPATLKVDIGDRTFASSTGALCHSAQSCSPNFVTYLEYATAMDCVTPGSSTGLANVDLTGTPFAIENTFVLGGYIPGGTSSLSPDGKVANLTGGGYCGWMSAGPGYHPVGSAGNYALSLRYVGARYADCTADADGDGVLDADDACPGTAPGAAVNANGCSVAELCPCVATWKSHGAYVSCVAHASEAFVGAGLISSAQKDATVSAAAMSSCGTK